MKEYKELLFDRIGVFYITRHWWAEEQVASFWKIVGHFLSPNEGEAWFRSEAGQWISADENNLEELREHLEKAVAAWAGALGDDFDTFKFLKEEARFALFMDADRFRACVEDGSEVPGDFYVGFDADWCWNPDADVVFTPHFRITNCWPQESRWAPSPVDPKDRDLLSVDQVNDILWFDYWVKVEDKFKAVEREFEFYRAQIDVDDDTQQPTVFFYASPCERQNDADQYLENNYIRPMDLMSKELLLSPDIRSMEITGGVMEGKLAVFNHTPKVENDYCLMIPLAGHEEAEIEKTIEFVCYGWQDIDFDATWEIRGLKDLLKPHERFFVLWNQSLTEASGLNEQLFSLLSPGAIQGRMFDLAHLLSGLIAKLQARTAVGAMKRKESHRDMEAATRKSKALAQRKFTVRKISNMEMMGNISDGNTRVFKEYNQLISKGANEAEKLSENIENIGKSLSHTSELEERRQVKNRERQLEKEEKSSKLLNRVLALVAVLAAIPLLVGEYDTAALSTAVPWAHIKINTPFSFWGVGLQFTFWTALVTFGLTIWALSKTVKPEKVSHSDQSERLLKVKEYSQALFAAYRGYVHDEMKQKVIFEKIIFGSVEDDNARETVHAFDVKLAYVAAGAIDQCQQWQKSLVLPEDEEAWAEDMEKKVCSFVLMSEVFDLRPEMLYLPVTLGLLRFMHAKGNLHIVPVSDYEFNRVMGRYGYSEDEIKFVNAWGKQDQHTQLTATAFVGAYVGAGIDVLHKVDLSELSH